ncbi:ATP-binding protein [Geomonas sp. Red32]|uniref:hybrid sensor histidine kinase/response regulator n=1 Tax=Geomonas sp. Red32 TaxID=2912856 RepID=UPI00202CB7BA|nr:ATP-binding protein [Geomonas sp. Red32]MCM0080058.1 ATP-binding protein [Geomonas sp. Red32]
MNARQLNRRLTPLNISIIYAVIGVAWGAVFCLFPVAIANPGDLAKVTAETASHTLFIFATAALLFFLIRRSDSETSRGRESLSRVNRALKTFSGCNQAMVRATDELQLMKEICRTIVEIGGYKVAWVGMAEHDSWKKVRPVAQWGDQDAYLTSLDMSWADIDRGRGPTGTAIRTGTTRIVQNILYDPSWALWREEGIKHGFASSISLPLTSDGHPLGALVIFAAEKRAFGKEEVKLLEELAQDLSFGISTLRMNAERRVVEKEKKMLASVVEQSMEGIILLDPDGTIKYVNPAIRSITGPIPDEMVGKKINTLGEERQTGAFFSAIWTALCNGYQRTGNFIQKGEGGDLYEIDARLWSILDASGAVSNHAVLIRDVTHEVHLERQLRQAQRMEAIATLAGGIAHDFNNHLASIITCTELALDDIPEESSLKELMEVVLKSSHRGRKLVRQILTFCCQGEQERQPVEVAPILNECLNLLRGSFSSSISVRTKIADPLGLIMGDPTQIHQIIMNLTTNAIHAMGQKGGTLEVALENVGLDTAAATGGPDLPSGCYLKLTIKDTGHGMAPAVMERIFDPFFTTKGKTEGTGLGLSVVHGIVRNHGGAITVSSRPGEGSTFEVFLPRIGEPGVAEPAVKAPALALSGGERILFVDDEEEVAFSAKKMLERMGYRVTVGRDGLEGLKLFKARADEFDLVITDQTMPGMTGTELTREVISIRPDIPVILCTGLGPAAEKALQRAGEELEGIREVAHKPLDREEMAAAIRRALTRPQEGQGEHGAHSDHR